MREGDTVEILSLNQIRNCSLMRGLRVKRDTIEENEAGEDDPNSAITVVSNMFRRLGTKQVISEISSSGYGTLIVFRDGSGYSWNNWHLKEFYAC